MRQASKRIPESIRRGIVPLKRTVLEGLPGEDSLAELYRIGTDQSEVGRRSSWRRIRKGLPAKRRVRRLGGSAAGHQAKPKKLNVKNLPK
jgi:hypothetical protein